MKWPRGKDYLSILPLIDAGTNDYLATIPTIAAGDVKLRTDEAVIANPTARILGFDGGGGAGAFNRKPQPGDVLGENGGDGVATVMFVVTVAGTWAGGDASGFIFVKSVSGTWSDNAQIDNTTRSITDIATADAGTTGTYTLAANQLANTAGLFAFANKRAFVAVTASEMECRKIGIELIDSATKEWEDTGDELTTEDHPLADDPAGCLFAGTAQSVAAGTLVAQASLDGIANPLSADANIAACLVIYIESASTGAGQAVPVSSFTHGTLTYNLLHNFPLTPTGTIVYKVYSIARMPAHVMAAVSGVQVSLEDDAITVAALAADTGTEIGTAVWASGTRTLTALDEDSTTLDINAAVQAAVGLASANLDTQLADIEGKVDDLETRLGTPSDLGSGATVAGNLVDIEAQTDDIGALTTAVADIPTNAELATALAAADDAVLAAVAALNNLSAAAVNSEVDTAIADAFGIVTGSVNDAAATVNGFTVTDTAGADIRLGTLRFTSGALAGESRLVTWTGTTVAVVKPTSVPAGLTTIGPFSAAPANGVTYTFRPL